MSDGSGAHGEDTAVRPTSTGGHRHRGRRYARQAIALVVACVSLYVLLPGLIAVFSSWRSLTHVRPLDAALVFVCEGVSVVCLWELDRIALQERSWFVVATTQATGNSVGRVLPGGGATATAVSASLLHRAGLDTSRAATGLAASTGLQLATTLALPVFALPAIVGGAPVAHGLLTAVYLGLCVLVVLLGAGALSFTTDRPVRLAGNAVQWLLNKTVRRRRPVSGLGNSFLADRDSIRSALGDRWRAALFSAVANAGFDYLALLSAVHAVGGDPRPSLVLLAYTAAELLALVPLTPGGVGFVEAGLVGTLSLAGVGGQQALAATLLYRVAAFWLPIPAGAAAYALFVRRYPAVNSRTRSASPPMRPGAEPGRMDS